MISFTLLIAVFLVVCSKAAFSEPTRRPLFEDSDGIYNYCPSLVEDSGARWVFYCSNRDPGKIIDYIACRRGIPKGDGWEWSEKRLVLESSDEGWDEVHACDPDVLGGLFRKKEKEYRFALFYLGCDTHDCTHNQTGVAFAESIEGPWEKWPGNPMVAYPRDRHWGVGQASAISIDRKGKIRLFYTQGGTGGTCMYFRDMDLSDLDNPIIDEPVRLPTNGLTNRLGSGDFLNNGALAYDPDGDIYYLVRDRHPADKESPRIIVSEVQVACIDGEAIGNPAGEWKIIGNITSEISGKPRNHNACIVKDMYGRLPEKDKVAIIYSVSDLAPFPECLWTYRLHEYTFPVIP